MHGRITHSRRTLAALASTAVVATGLLTGCASSSSSGGGTPTPSVNPGGPSTPRTSASKPQMSQTVETPSSSDTASCSPSTMQTQTANTLTVATDSPAYEPWFVDNDPTNGKGFESAVAYAVAKQLGYSSSQVKWVTAPFTSVIAPTPKNFDFDINEVSITPTRAQAVDFSSGYYDVAQAVVTLKGSSIANATSIADLKGATLGAQQGTTSYAAITDVIKPAQVREYPTNPEAVQALQSGAIDGLVVDLPTGLYITAAQIKGSTIVGQLPVQGHPEQFGLVLDHGSSLTPCVTQAVNALRKDGTLADLQKKWLTDSAGAPVLK